ncbi:unnamed protein product [Symbiodinium sp. CCMP2592]|nr:unnamed protein product [Symbiodinium sp. CCMP2592]
MSLEKLGRKSYISQRGLADVLTDLKESKQPLTATSRQSIKRARDKVITQTTPYGPVWETLRLPRVPDGKESNNGIDVPVLCLPAFLHHACAKLTGFSQFFLRRLQECPCRSPNEAWRAAIYNDEVAPGNQLKGNNSRKIQVWYMAWLEYGQDHLFYEELWMPLLMIRSNLVKLVEGGLSAVTARLVQHSFRGVHNLESGILLSFPGHEDSRMFFGKPTVLLADESALKHMLDTKGASGTVPCTFCANVVSKRTEGDSDDLLTICSTDVARFRMRSDEALFKAAEHLVDQSTKLSNAKLAELEQAMGLNTNQFGLLATRCLGASSCMFDWMHIYLVHGVAHAEVNCILERMVAVKIPSTQLHDFCDGLQFPKADAWKKKEVMSMFTSKKISPGDFKAAASTCLCFYPLLRLFFMSTPEIVARMTEEARSYSHLCAVLDYLAQANRGETRLQAGKLQTLIQTHCEHFVRTYGGGPITPKFHMTMHLPFMLKKFDQLVACFTHERKHKHIKRIGDQLHSSQLAFEASVAHDIWFDHFQDYADLSLDNGPALVGRDKAAEPILKHELLKVFGIADADVHPSQKCCIKPGTTIARGDVVVMHGDVVGELWLNFRLHGEHWCIVSIYEAMGRNVFAVAENPLFVKVSSVRSACIFRREGHDKVRIVP